MSSTWITTRSETSFRVARARAVRWDVQAQVLFPECRPSRLARQIRQDMWRQLQNLRGFSPIVEIIRVEGGLMAKAGGQIDGRFPRAHVEGLIAAVLDDPVRRARWLQHARRGADPDTEKVGNANA